MGSLVHRSSVALVLALSCASGAFGAGKPPVTIADVRRQVGVESPQISPDGTHVAFVRRTGDYAKDRYVDDLMLVEVRSRRVRVLVHDAQVDNVRWSPAGDRIAYTAVLESADEHERVPQLFVLPMNGGAPLQLTHETKGIHSIDWRPDGTAIAFTAPPPEKDAKAIEHHEDAFDVAEESWVEQSPTDRNALYEVRSDGGAKPRRIGNDSWSAAGDFTYAADGRTLFVTRIDPGSSPNQYLAQTIVRVDARSGALSPIDRRSRTQYSPLRSADGRYVAFAFTNPAGSMQTEVAIGDGNARYSRWASRRLDRNVAGAAFDTDDSLVVLANDATARRFFRLARDGRTQPLPLGDVDALSSPSIARDGSIAFAGETPAHPGEVYLLPPHAARPIALTNLNEYVRNRSIGRHESFVWRTRDGMTADGVLYYPPDRAAHALPLVLDIHGGPTYSSSRGFSLFDEALAAHGWLVFAPNYRGSDNLGLQFARTTVPHIASVPGNDIEDGIAALLARRGLVDPSRMGVSGWSEGGLMTSWLITHDTRFKAAVSGAAVNDWMGYSQLTDSKDFTPQFIVANQWLDARRIQLFAAESPLTFASRVKTPTLILSDANDYRVPTPLAYEFYHELRAAGTPVQFVVWPVVGHFPQDPVRREDVYRRWEAWLVQYLK